MAGSTSSYIDVEKLAGPDFSPHAHANSLVLSTNNPSDASVDLTTPLSKALFDLQEIDSNIHTLTSRSALEILQYTSTQNAAAARIIVRVEEERSRLTASYSRLEKEILGQYEKATSAKLHAERSHQILRLGRNVQRILNLARQFEVILADSGLSSPQPSVTVGRNTANKEDHRLILHASYMILSFRDLMSGKDASDLGKINVVRTIRGRVFEDGEARVIDYGRRIIREFAISSLTSATTTTAAVANSSFKDTEDAKSRFTSASHILYLLSPAPQLDGKKLAKKDFEAEYLLRALQGYLQTAITSSSAGIARGLGQLPTLDRALLEVSARCQNVVALEALLRGIVPPAHPMLLNERKASKSAGISSTTEDEDYDDKHEDDDDMDDAEGEGEEGPNENLLTLLLESLDTSSLPSYFWRSLASQLSSRVQEILSRGGIVARTLKANRDEVRNQIRDCVLKGSKMPSSLVTGGGSANGISGGSGGRGKEQTVGGWEREAAVMVGSVVGPLGK